MITVKNTPGALNNNAQSLEGSSMTKGLMPVRAFASSDLLFLEDVKEDEND